VERDTLFIALTRPALTGGVPFEGFVANLLITFFVGLWLGNPLYWLAGIIIHFPMRIIASKDYNFFRTWRLWLATKGQAIGNDAWGGASLAPMPDHPATKSKDVRSGI
jgi:type IV secretion system protein VirB3